MEYGDVLFAGSPNFILDKLFKIEFEALKIITGAITGTSKMKLILEYGKPLLIKRQKTHVLYLFYKICKNRAPQYLSNILSSFERNPFYRLRDNFKYLLPQTRSSSYLKSFFPLAISLWNSLPLDYRNAKSLESFKSSLHQKTKVNILYYYGERWANIHHARLRMGCSLLNGHLFTNIHVVNSPKCNCGYPYEDINHFFNFCPKFDHQRAVLKNTLINSNLLDLDLNPNPELLLYGDKKLNVDQNLTLFQAVHEYLRTTNRFL
jgi:hypothetical protein